MAKRKQPTKNRRNALLAEVNHFCPLCKADLLVKKNGRHYVIAEAAHIYPLEPTLEDLIALEDVEQPDNVNDDSNFIMLCPSCHTRFDHPRTKVEYLQLADIKKNLAEARSLQALFPAYPLEEEIQTVVMKLCEYDPSPNADLSTIALQVDQNYIPILID